MISRKLFTIIYLSVAASSLFIVASATANYLQFFPALQSMQAMADRQQVIIDSQTNSTRIHLDLRVSNPSTYSGFTVQSVNIQLYFTAMNTSLFQNVTLFSPNTINTPIGPGNTIRLNATFLFREDQSRAFVAFYNRYRGVAVSHYILDIRLITFLEAFTGIDVERGIEYRLQ